MGRPLSGRGRAGSARSLLGAAPGRESHAPERVAVIVKLRRLRMTAAEIAETLGDAALDRLRDPDPARAWAGSAGSGSSRPSATSAPGRASSSTSTSRSSAGSRRCRPPHRGSRASTTTAVHRRAGRPAASPAGSSSTSPSTTTRASPTPKCSPTRKPTTAAGFLRRAVAFYRRHGITVERVLTDNGAAYRRRRPRPRLPPTRHPPPPHPTLPATNQRQSRALHPHHARRLGLRRHLRLKPRTHRRP